MARGRPIPPLHLSELERWTRRAKTSQALALRARIVWSVRLAGTTSPPPKICGSATPRWAGGEGGFWPVAWMVWYLFLVVAVDLTCAGLRRLAR